MGSTIIIRSGFFPLLWVFFFFKPEISVDGSPWQTYAWGETRFDVAPGQHTIAAQVPYIFFKIFKAQQTVNLQPGETAVFSYRARWIVLLPGKLKPVQPAAV